MTAKEYVQRATHDRIIVFERSEFTDFCEQFAAEQREICLNNMIDLDGKPRIDRANFLVLNAPMPEL